MNFYRTAIFNIFILFALSCIGALMAFKVIDSSAFAEGIIFGITMKTTGGIAGFIIIYGILFKSLQIFRTPSLTSYQTRPLIKLWQEHQANKYKLLAIENLDKFYKDKEITKEKFYEEAEAARLQSRDALSIFHTPLGDLSQYFEKVFNINEFKNDIDRIIGIIISEKDPIEKRIEIVKHIDNRLENLGNKYLTDLKSKDSLHPQ